MLESDADDVPGPPSAVESGRICAVAGQAQREVRDWAAGYGELFGAKPFDAALFNTVCLCTAFSAPWFGSADLRITNRAALWGFGVDWLIDYVATSRDGVRDVVDRCRTVADGGPPADGDELMRALADIRDELASAPAFPALGHVWQDELRRFVAGMAREWDWNAARTGGANGPAFDEYLENSDNLGFCFAFVSHWISTAESPPADADVEQIRSVSRTAQRTMRLINDLGTYARDVSWGDLNALMLGVTQEDVHACLAELTEVFRKLAAPLRASHPRLVSYMERQVDFCDGFQGLTDYWGTL